MGFKSAFKGLTPRMDKLQSRYGHFEKKKFLLRLKA
jgi:hypothetical protein